MWKLATLFFAAAALRAGVIQLNPYEIQITGTVTGNATSTFDVSFYYSGPFTPSDHIILDTGFNSSFPCPITTLEPEHHEFGWGKFRGSNDERRRLLGW
jgi:hypothetical protein